MTGPVVLTGGGTGGHVFPLRAIADALLASGVERDRLVIVGSARGQERALLGDLGVELVLLPGRGLRRDVSPRAVVTNVAAVGGLLVAAVRGVWLVIRRRPAVVVSVGGYAAFAAAAGAVASARPLVLVDLDATEGLVHRALHPFAVGITSAFPSAERRVVLTGAPVRAELIGVERSDAAREAARDALGIARAGTVVAVVTGSLGAASVNDAVGDLAERWRDRDGVLLYHVTGRRDHATVETRRVASGIEPTRWRVVEFEHQMAAVYAACDLAVTRAGATTVAELCATGTPSVVVPLPGAPGDHQGANARELERVGAAVVLQDAAVSAVTLDATLSALLDDPGRLATMSAAARGLGRPDAADQIAEVVLARAR